MTFKDTLRYYAADDEKMGLLNRLDSTMAFNLATAFLHLDHQRTPGLSGALGHIAGGMPSRRSRVGMSRTGSGRLVRPAKHRSCHGFAHAYPADHEYMVPA